jgi:hypothetical protein
MEANVVQDKCEKRRPEVTDLLGPRAAESIQRPSEKEGARERLNERQDRRLFLQTTTTNLVRLALSLSLSLSISLFKLVSMIQRAKN